MRCRSFSLSGFIWSRAIPFFRFCTAVVRSFRSYPDFFIAGSAIVFIIITIAAIILFVRSVLLPVRFLPFLLLLFLKPFPRWFKVVFGRFIVRGGLILCPFFPLGIGYFFFPLFSYLSFFLPDVFFFCGACFLSSFKKFLEA